MAKRIRSQGVPLALALATVPWLRAWMERLDPTLKPEPMARCWSRPDGSVVSIRIRYRDETGVRITHQMRRG